MSQLISQEKIAEIQQASDIVQIISEHVALKNTGKNYIGLCPFHNEKTPSFTVNQERQFYKCFGCGEAGTVFTFLMKVNGMKFPEVATLLANRANIVLPKSSVKGKTNDVISRQIEINAYFADFYQKYLLNSKMAATTRRYITGRGINEEFVRKFRIGYAPDSWDASLKEAASQKFDVNDSENAGIILKRKSGKGYYDRFRNRLIFPIFNETGKAVGFGARALEDVQPKYVNSPESPIFNKRRILYGLDLAKNSIMKRGEAVLMEGYTDVVMAHQNGIDWAVGVMGTSLTGDHLKLLKMYCKQVVLVLDADAAGIKSADKSAGLLMESGFDVKIVQLPEGVDPCECIVSEGKAKFLNRVESASDFFDFKLNIAGKRGELSNVASKTKVFNDIISAAMKIPDNLKRNVQIKDIAEKIKIDESELRIHLSKINKNFARGAAAKTGFAEKAYSGSAKFSGQDNADSREFRRKQAACLVEKELIRLMIYDNKFIPVVKSEIKLEHFSNGSLRTICKGLFETFDVKGCIAGGEVFSIFDESDLHKMVADIVSIKPAYEDFDVAYKECKQYIDKQLSFKESEKIKTRMLQSRQDEKAAEEGETDEDINTLLARRLNERKKYRQHKGDDEKMLEFRRKHKKLCKN